MMWCYCYHHRAWKILREFTYEDDFNNTFLFKMSFNRGKISKKMRYVKVRMSDNRKSVEFPPVSDPSIFW